MPVEALRFMGKVNTFTTREFYIYISGLEISSSPFSMHTHTHTHAHTHAHTDSDWPTHFSCCVSSSMIWWQSVLDGEWDIHFWTTLLDNGGGGNTHDKIYYLTGNPHTTKLTQSYSHCLYIDACTQLEGVFGRCMWPCLWDGFLCIIILDRCQL